MLERWDWRAGHEDEWLLALFWEDGEMLRWAMILPAMFLPAVILSALFFPQYCAGQEIESGSRSKVIRIGIIGLDTPHSSRFAQILNDPKAPAELSGCKVVAAVAQNSPDIEESLRYAEKTAEQIRAMEIEIVATIDDLLQRVDAVLLETNDGRMHLEQVLPVLKKRIPVFVDKPVAASLADVIAIYRAAQQWKVPIFSSSSLRYTDGAKAIGKGAAGSVVGCDAYSPCPIEKTHPDLFWYGIHGVETLYTMMGPGCESVVRVSTDDTDMAIGKWKDGRVGTFRGRRKPNNQYAGGYGGTVFGTKAVHQIGGFSGYEPLVVEIVRFFKTGKPPVSAAETIEIYTFMTAADQSKRRPGSVVKLAEVLKSAESLATQRLKKLSFQ